MMAKAVKQPASGPEKSGPEKIVLSIDIGGSHVKILTKRRRRGAPRRLRAGPDASADDRCGQELAGGLSYDVISMGLSRARSANAAW
ncbi:hypothetical protein NKH19_09255 [Mesorhizobium sp. M1338]